MTLDQTLEAIRDARAKGMPWHEVVARMREAEALPECRQRFPTPARFKDHVAELTGYTRNTIQRMLVAEGFLKARAPELEGIGSDPFCGAGNFFMVELAKRAWDVSPEGGLGLLHRILTEQPKHKDVRKDFEVIVGNPPFAGTARTSHRLSARWSKLAFSALEGGIDAVYGDERVQLYYRRYRFGRVDVDAVAVGAAGHTVDFVDGFDFLTRLDLERGSASQTFFARTEFKASFFRRYWIAIPEEELQHRLVIEGLSELGIKSVGLIRIFESGTLSALHTPSAAPVPDRQDAVKTEVFGQGVPVSW